MTVPDFTLCVGVDLKTAQQLEGVWPTWRLNRPGLFDRPMMAFCDWQAGNERFWRHRLRFIDHPRLTLHFWDWPRTDDTEFGGMTQRERMLTGWVKVPPAVVETPYWLKVDTDVVATCNCPWVLPEWFHNEPAIVACPWGYTKPADVPARLDAWAATVPHLAPLRALNLPPVQPGQETIGHPRICSWVAWFDTLFTRHVADMVPGRLPVPSQDSLHWYVAWREERVIERVRAGKYGWRTVSGGRGRARLVEEVMAPMKKGCCD